MSIRMILENVDMKYKMKIAYYVSVFSLVQYFLCLSNWNKMNNPQVMPVPFNKDLSGTGHFEHYIKTPLPLPWVDKINTTEIWKKYMLVDKNIDILHSIMFETIVL